MKDGEYREKLDGFAARLRGCALHHGLADDPDHEVGDLQDLFSAAFRHLTPDGLRKFLAEPAAVDVLDGPEFEETWVEFAEFVRSLPGGTTT